MEYFQLTPEELKDAIVEGVFRRLTMGKQPDYTSPYATDVRGATKVTFSESSGQVGYGTLIGGLGKSVKCGNIGIEASLAAHTLHRSKSLKLPEDPEIEEPYEEHLTVTIETHGPEELSAEYVTEIGKAIKERLAQSNSIHIPFTDVTVYHQMPYRTFEF